MKAVILAGGFGTRISEESHLKPKPMVEIGGRPIIWHIMKLYSYFGINEFVICLGYKGYVIKEYFANYVLHSSDVTIDVSRNEMAFHNNCGEPWKITLVDTGSETMTGGRLKRVREHLSDDTFCFTYGDGLSDVNIKDLIRFHKSHGLLATVTATQPPGRYGTLELGKNAHVKKFKEKIPGDGAWINGGFFVLEPGVFDYIESDDTSWEDTPMELLSSNGQIAAYRHTGFWHAMDTIRDKAVLDNLWNETPPWRLWK